MGDQSHRKLPPDRPSDALANGSNKKKKEENESQSIEDTPMSEEVYSREEVAMEQGDSLVGKKCSVSGVPMSYKASLLGFNGIAHGGDCMEEEDLLSDTINRDWELPEPSEEVLELMKLHPVVPITADEYNSWCRPWNAALILTVLGKRFNVYALKSHLSRIWSTSDFDLVDMPNNYFIVRFLQKEGWGHLYHKILYGGPWIVQQHTVLVQKWTPHFDPFNNPLGRIVTWVRIPNVPMQCYNKEFLTRLGNCIGRTMKIDLLTPSDVSSAAARIERGRYARICVELDLQKRLVSKVIAAHSVYQVEYEGLGLICFACGRYGHHRDSCQWVYKESNQGDSGQTSSERPMVVAPAWKKPAPNVDEHFGSWMIAGRSRRGWTSRRNNQRMGAPDVGRGAAMAQGGRSTPSGFNVLAEIGEDDELAMETRKTADGQQGVGNLGKVRTDEGESKANQIAVGPKVWQKKGQNNKLGKSKMTGPKELREAQVEKKNQTQELGQESTRTGAGPSKNNMGRREHLIVGGNISQNQSQPIGMVSQGKKQQNKSILLIEGPIDSGNKGENLIIKEKGEKNMSLVQNEVLHDSTNMILDEDIGDDFMRIEDSDPRPQFGEAQTQKEDRPDGIQ